MEDISSSASSGGGRVFDLQALLKAAEQKPVLFVLLLFLGVELSLQLKAQVHDEGRAQHGEPVTGHVELTGLEEGGRGRESRSTLVFSVYAFV